MTQDDAHHQKTPVLATDLDGTLIPLDADAQNRRDLQTLTDLLSRGNVQLVYSTGRHFESVCRAITQFDLPAPDWIICDVGTSIFHRRPSAGYALLDAYQQHLSEIVAELPIHTLRTRLEPIEGLLPQEDEKQGQFKLSYYVVAARLPDLAGQVRRYLESANAPYSVIQSVDPFNGDGLIDLLPRDVSKAHALVWWSRHAGLSEEEIVFAGDSGNDLAALTAGYRAIVVGNAERSLVEQVQRAHRQAGWSNRLYLARQRATSGVLEGCRAFGLVDHG